MTAEHYAEVDLTDPDWPTVTFVCTGGPGDECHQWCAEGCEEQCYLTDDGRRHRWEPMPPDGSSCRIVDWLDAIGAQDSYAGDDEPWRGEVARPGRHRIEEEWTGEDYIWSYLDPEPSGVPV